MIPGHRFIGWVSRLVPAARRSDWRREWEAEVAYAWSRLKDPSTRTRFGATRLRFRTLTCLIDAFLERMQTMTMTGLLNDLRGAARALLRYPGFTAITIATLALGIGAITAVFTLVDGVLIQPLPFQEADRLVSLEHLGREGRDELPMSTGLYTLYRDQVGALEELGLFRGTVANLIVEGEPERLQAQSVTPGFFGTLRVEAALGRTFLEEEGVPGAEPVVILSDGLWKSHFGANPDVLGQTVDMSGVSRRIVGVMPSDFGHPTRLARLWLPFLVDPNRARLAAFGADGVGRLAAESSVASLTTELEGVIGRLSELFPGSGEPAFLNEVGLRPLVRPLKDAVVGGVSSTLWIVLGMVGFVLLIACANVANLLLVRAESRHREIALRVAVGASRWQVVRTFMSESVLLAGAGAVIGTALAWVAVKGSVGLIPADVPRIGEVGIDFRVLAFTAVLTLGCAVFFGLFPLVRYPVSDLAGQLREGSGRGATKGKNRHRLSNGLVVTQMALALVLLVGSGLMYRSFQALRSVDPGFERENVLTARVSLPSAEIAGWQQASDLFRQLRERMEAQPGVVAVGLGTRAPLNGGLSYTSLEVEDHPRSEDELPVFSSNMQVEPGFLEALSVQVLEGRTIRPEDGAQGMRAVVVSESFGQHWWPDSSPVGRRLRAGYDGEDWYQIVGVVADVHFESLEGDPEEMVYYPTTMGLAEGPISARTMDLVVKTASDPLSFVSVVRRELRELNSRIPLANPQTMDVVFAGATSRTSFAMALLGAASGIALLLGLVGIYGVMSYVVSQRTREIGVRMALGASAPNVRRMVVRQGLVLAAVGTVLGLLGARLLSSLVESILYGVSATDPVTYGSVAAALVAVSLVASWLPARRASGVDPSSALRND